MPSRRALLLVLVAAALAYGCTHVTSAPAPILPPDPNAPLPPAPYAAELADCIIFEFYVGYFSAYPGITDLDRAVMKEAQSRSEAVELMKEPGVEPVMALAFVLTIGDVSRFRHSNQVASYLGLIPREHSSGGKQRLGAITKQGNRFMRQLLVESAG